MTRPEKGRRPGQGVIGLGVAGLLSRLFRRQISSKPSMTARGRHGKQKEKDS